MPSLGRVGRVARRKSNRRALRAVLDTNIAVSALLFPFGRLAPIRLAWQGDTFIPLVSTATAEELIRVLKYPKFKLTAADRDELVADYLPYCTTVRIPDKAPRIPACRDPDDLPFLHLGTHGRADFLVTGDKDLLDIRDATRFAIVTAEAFIAKLSRS